MEEVNGATWRYERHFDIGDRGAQYEFNVKLRGLPEDMTEADLEIEVESALEHFSEDLRERYPWVGEVGTAGRSGGWLSVQDKSGGATEKDLNAISRMVEKAKDRFVKWLNDEYAFEFAVNEEIDDSDEAWVFVVSPGRASSLGGSLKMPGFARIDASDPNYSALNVLNGGLVGPVFPVINRKTASLTDDELRTIGLAGRMVMLKMLPKYLEYVKRYKAHHRRGAR